MISAKIPVPVVSRPVARLSARKVVRVHAEKNPIEQASEAVQQAADRAGDALQGGAAQAKDKADEAASNVQQSGQQAASSVQQGGQKAGEEVSAWGDEAKTNEKAADAWFQEKKGQAQPATQAAKEVEEGR